MTANPATVPAGPDEPTPFDPCEPVAEGITLLEASAGTGKTHAVTSLVVREVAHGRRLDELLVVTFTRKATGTLRERVWRRLTEAARYLTPDATGRSEPIDPLLDHLRSGGPHDVTTRRRRLERALSDFDAATIATTHGFCQHVLSGLGVAGDAERDLVLVDDLGALVPDAVDDLFVRRFHAGGDVTFPHHAARQMARAIIANPDCELADIAASDTDRLRRRFARTLRERIVEQKRRARIITYDDLLARLADSLADPERGADVAERLRRRFTMAIVDEFQDTDSVQWHILRTAFGTAPSRLVLVGDPKQAIYAFRGGDVFAYLQATRDAGRRRGLPVSWRADQPLLDSIDAIFAGAQLGDPAIRHRPLRARPGADASALGGAAPDALSVRIADRNPDDFALTSGGWAVKASVRRFIATDLADYTARLLQAGRTIEGRAVGAGDLAVLTRTRSEAEAIATALLAAGVPAVVHGASSVLRTKAARHWLDLLRALERPSSETRVNAVAIGPFVGWDADRLALATDHDREDLDTTLHDWAAAMRTRSVGGLFRLIEATGDLASRLSGRVGGDRLLADLRHVAELLHHHQMAIPGSVAGLIRWLAEQIAEADQVGSDRTRRRLESDADAVAVHTIHSAKGLEFPIVFLPSAWEAPPETRDDTIPVFHGDDGGRRIGVGGRSPVRNAEVAQAEQERDDEDLRLLYVALTRARHQVVLWWASGYDADRSAFARVLLGRDDDGVVTRSLSPPPGEAAIAGALRALGIPVHRAGTTGTRYHPPAEPAAGLAVRAFEREFDRYWARTSYTGLTRAAHQAGAASAAPGESDDDDLNPDADAGGIRTTDPLEVDEGARVDEPSVSPAPGPTEADGALGTVLPLGGLPGGARIGTLVHHVLERTDFAADDLPAELARAVTDAGARRVLDGDADVLAAGLALSLDTPLGAGLGGIRLREVHRADRLDELAFDLPLAGGDEPGPALVTMGALAATFARLPAGDPMAGYHERLDDPLLATAGRGFLTGSIDLVARLGGRYLVVDYKTNHLAPHGEDPVAWHYRPAALTEAMMAAHYPLQAAFYAVALHRFLRWRLSGYRPDGHLAGVAYLFLRGMTGVDTPTVDGAPCGVFTWNPPTRFVLELSDVLDRGVLDGGPS